MSQQRNRKIGYAALAVLIIALIVATSPQGTNTLNILGDSCEREILESPDGDGFQNYDEFRRAADTSASNEELQEAGLLLEDGVLTQETCGGETLG